MAAIMCAKTPTEGKKKKPFVKHEGWTSNQHDGQHNANCRGNPVKKKKFLGVDPDICVHVFRAKSNQSEQVANFTTVNDIIKTQVGTECDSFVLESLEKEVKSGPEEPAPVLNEDGTMTKIEETKFKRKYDKYLNRVHKVEMQPK